MSFTSWATRTLSRTLTALSVPDEFGDRRSIGLSHTDFEISVLNTESLERAKTLTKDTLIVTIEVEDGVLELRLKEYQTGPVYFELHIRLVRENGISQKWQVALPNWKPESHALVIQRLIASWIKTSSSPLSIDIASLGQMSSWRQVVECLERTQWGEE